MTELKAIQFAIAALILTKRMLVQTKEMAISSSSEKYEPNTMGFSWERYSHLEEKFTSLSDKNEMEHTALRQELEGKIEKSSDGIKGDIKELSQRID